MSLFKQFATDAKKEAEGVRISYAPNSDGSIPTFIIARMGKSNKKYSKALEVATRPYRRQMELGTLANETAEAIFLKVFVDTILLGWEFVQDENEIFMDCKKENAIRLFEKLPELYEDLQKQANSVVLFRNEALEDEAKN